MTVQLQGMAQTKLLSADRTSARTGLARHSTECQSVLESERPMTQTILDFNDDNHRLLLAQWDAAGHAHTEHERLECKTELSSPNKAQGHIQLNRRGAHILMHGRLQQDIHNKPILGDRIVQCPYCTTLFASFSHHGHHYKSARRYQAQAQRSEAMAKWRRNRQTKRSYAPSSSLRDLHVLGNTFALKRITAKTCSEKCRKLLPRKPELAEQYMQLPPVRTDVAALKAGHAAKDCAGLHENRKDENDLESLRILSQQRNYRKSDAIKDQAPALMSLIVHHSEKIIL